MFEELRVMPRAIVLHGLFGAALFFVGILAVATALGTSGPWFSSAVSMEVYGISLLGAILLAVLLASVAGGLRARLDEALRSLDLRLAALPEAMGLPRDRELVQADLVAIPPSDEEVDDLLEVLEKAPPDSGVAELQVTGTLVEVSTAITAARTRRELLKAVVRQRSEVLAVRGRIASAVAGPIFAGVAFALVAGPMLPGVEGFAAQNFQLNTASVLFLAYGWGLVLAWAVLAIGWLFKGPRTPPAS